MLEIYNEQVRDLLDSSRQKGGLRVRQHPKLGFYGKNSFQTDKNWLIDYYWLIIFGVLRHIGSISAL